MSSRSYTVESCYQPHDGRGTIRIIFKEPSEVSPEKLARLVDEEITRILDDLPSGSMITSQLLHRVNPAGAWFYDLQMIKEEPQASDELGQQFDRVLAVAQELGLNNGPFNNVALKHSDAGWLIADPDNAVSGFLRVSKDLGETQALAEHVLLCIHEALMAVTVRHPQILTIPGTNT